MARLAVRMNTDALGQLLVKSQRDTIALLLRKNLIDLKALAQSLHETLGVICSAGRSGAMPYTEFIRAGCMLALSIIS